MCFFLFLFLFVLVWLLCLNEKWWSSLAVFSLPFLFSSERNRGGRCLSGVTMELNESFIGNTFYEACKTKNLFIKYCKVFIKDISDWYYITTIHNHNCICRAGNTLWRWNMAFRVLIPYELQLGVCANSLLYVMTECWAFMNVLKRVQDS